MDPLWGRSTHLSIFLHSCGDCYRWTPCGVEAPPGSPRRLLRKWLQMDPLWGRSHVRHGHDEHEHGYRWTPCGVEALLKILLLPRPLVTDGPLVGSKRQSLAGLPPRNAVTDGPLVGSKRSSPR